MALPDLIGRCLTKEFQFNDTVEATVSF